MYIELWKKDFGNEYIRKLLDGTMVLEELASYGFSEDGSEYCMDCLEALMIVGKEIGYSQSQVSDSVDEASVEIFGKKFYN